MRDQIRSRNKQIYLARRGLSFTKVNTILLLLILHIPMAFLMRGNVTIATFHAISILLLGLFLAITSKDSWILLGVVAYISGAEVLWRMTEAQIFWEFGKYATSLILIVGLFRFRKFKKPIIPILYFILLCLSIPLTIGKLGLSNAAQEVISFSLSGPLSLSVCLLFSTQIKLKIKNLEEISWLYTAPTISILTLAAYDTLSTKEIQFFNASNFITSGGFGPNQVSAVLGLTALMMFLISILTTNYIVRWLAFITASVMLGQTALTFSRGGLFNAIISIVLSALLLLRITRARYWIFTIILFSLTLAFIFLPRINQFTGGVLEQRISNIETTGREKIIRGDILLWQKNIIWGVGPGLSGYERIQFLGVYVAPHNEFSRLLAEHGLLGLISLALLFILVASAYFRQPNSLFRALVIAFIVWSFLEMSHSAMRIIAIAFVLSLSVLDWDGRVNFTRKSVSI